MTSQTSHSQFNRVVLSEFVQRKRSVHRAAQEIRLGATRRLFFGIVSKRGAQTRFHGADAAVSAAVALSDGLEDEIRIPRELMFELSATVIFAFIFGDNRASVVLDEGDAPPNRA